VYVMMRVSGNGHHVGVVSGRAWERGQVRRGLGQDVREVGMTVTAGGDDDDAAIRRCDRRGVFVTMLVLRA
jgi:hypothetical protein